MTSPHRDRAAATSTDRAPLQTIGAFAAAVGLSPSAIRQYGERGLLLPADVTERSGYRYYAPEQQTRAIWIRRMRGAGLPLDSIQEVLDGDPAEATAILDRWVEDLKARADEVLHLTRDLKLSLQARTTRQPSQRTTAALDGATLRAAIRQVSGIAGTSDALIEIRQRTVAVTATDRFVLASRTALAAEVTGVAARLSVDARTVADWLESRRHVELVVQAPIGRGGRIHHAVARLREEGHDDVALDLTSDLFPDTDQIIAAASTARRVTFQREALRALGGGSGTTHLLSGGDAIGGELNVSSRALAQVVDFSVGDDLTCDVGSESQPLVWRSPSQPDFVVLMMRVPR